MNGNEGSKLDTAEEKIMEVEGKIIEIIKRKHTKEENPKL